MPADMASAPVGVTHRAAVLGSPISHSLSPVLHSAAYTALGLADWSYEAIECDDRRLPELIRSAGPEWSGFSVTMPGKTAAAAAADRRSARVELLGVANTLYREAGLAGWAAENTDVDGIVGALTSVGCAPNRALLLGGGGTAMAAVAALSELGTEDITFAGRRVESTAAALSLAEHLGIRTRRVPLQGEGAPDDTESLDRWAAASDLVVSTVPAGGADHLAERLAEVPVLLDAIYHPWPTPLAAAGVPGRVTVTGLDMLLHQALRQVRLMTGLPAPAAVMRQALLDATGADLPLRLG